MGGNADAKLRVEERRRKDEAYHKQKAREAAKRVHERVVERKEEEARKKAHPHQDKFVKPKAEAAPAKTYLKPWTDLYETIRVLGSGSFGTATLVRRKSDGEEVVLKHYPKSKAGGNITWGQYTSAKGGPYAGDKRDVEPVVSKF